MSKRELAKLAREIKEIKATLNKSADLESDFSDDISFTLKALSKTFGDILDKVKDAQKYGKNGDFDKAYSVLSDAESMSEDLGSYTNDYLRSIKQDAQRIVYSQPGRDPYGRN
jgi:hypothetical protein